MPSYSGVWTLPAQYQAIGSTNWPMGPGAPTSVTAAAGDTTATVSFVAPTFTGIPPGITGYLATSSPGGITATGASSPLSVTGLSNGTAYTFAVQATNGVQYGPAGTSGSVTPAAPRGVFAGGETTVTFAGAISSTCLTVTRGGLEVRTILTSGVPTGENVTFNSSTGVLTFARALEADEFVRAIFK